MTHLIATRTTVAAAASAARPQLARRTGDTSGSESPRRPLHVSDPHLGGARRRPLLPRAGIGKPGVAAGKLTSAGMALREAAAASCERRTMVIGTGRHGGSSPVYHRHLAVTGRIESGS